MKIGRLSINLNWNKKALKPGKVIVDRLGFSVVWLKADSLTFVNEGYLGNPDIYTVINKIARTASTAPWKVYRIKKGQEKNHKRYKSWTGQNATKESVQRAMQIKALVYEEDNDHELNKLLEQPNPSVRCREFTENSIGFKLITGERFWHVVKLDMGVNEGKPFAVYNLPPQYMNVKGDGTLFGIGGYELVINAVKALNLDEVIFSRYWNPDFSTSGEHLRGLSPLKAGTKLTTLSNSGLTRSVAMVDNAGAAGLLFEKLQPGVEGMSETAAGKLKQQINYEMLGSENANTVGLANGEFGYISFAMKGSEMELLAMQKLTRERIANLYNAPPGLFDPEKSGEHNAKEFKKELITAACIPELDSMRDDWNEIAKLYEEEIYVDYDLSIFPELQEDLKTQAEIANMAWWIKGNEKRLMMYLDEDNEDENMDKYIIPSGLQLLDDIGMNEVDQTLLNDQEGNQQGGNDKVPKD